MQVKLKKVRLSFSDLFTPGEKFGKYGATFMIPKGSANDKIIQDAVAQVALEKWPDEKKRNAQLKTLKSKDDHAYRDGDENAKYENYAGHMILSSTAKARPLVIDRDLGILTEADGRPYSGCYVNATVDIWAQDKSPYLGIRCSLQGVQFHSDGDSFTGEVRVTPADFDDLSMDEDEDDDTPLA